MSLPTTTTHNWARIEGLINLSRKEKLIGYRWADALCTVVNPYLSLNKRISLENTGEEVETAIRTLPADMQVKILSVLVDIITGEISYGPDIDNPSYTPPHGDPTPPTQYERYEPPDHASWPVKGPGEDTGGKGPHSSIMQLIAVVLVGIAIVLTLTLTKIQRESGTAVKSSTLEVVLKVLGDVFTVTANTNPQSNRGDTTSDDTSEDEEVPVEEEVPPENAPRPTYGP